MPAALGQRQVDGAPRRRVPAARVGIAFEHLDPKPSPCQQQGQQRARQAGADDDHLAGSGNLHR